MSENRKGKKFRSDQLHFDSLYLESLKENPLGILLHGVHQNDPHDKPSFMVMVPDPYRRRLQYQGRRHVHSLHHVSQEPPEIDILYIKMIPMTSPTSWWWSRTHIANVADARGADMSIASIMSPKNLPKYTYYTKNDPNYKPDFMVMVPDPFR